MQELGRYEPLREAMREVQAQQNAPTQNPSEQPVPAQGTIALDDPEIARRAQIIEALRAEERDSAREITGTGKDPGNEAQVDQTIGPQPGGCQAEPQPAIDAGQANEEQRTRQAGFTYLWSENADMASQQASANNMIHDHYLQRQSAPQRPEEREVSEARAARAAEYADAIEARQQDQELTPNQQQGLDK